MELKDLQNAGSDILDAVSSAVSTGNYQNLSRTISSSVGTITKGVTDGLSSAMREAMTPGTAAQTPALRPGGAAQGWQTGNAQNQTWQQQRADMQAKTAQAGAPAWQQQNGVYLPPGVTANRRNYFFRQGWKRVSPYYGAGQMVAGILACVLTGGLALALFIAGIGIQYFRLGLFTAAGAVAVPFLLSCWLAYKGATMRQLYSHYREYGRLISTSDFYKIEDFAEKTGRSKETVIKELKAMQKAGFLPESWFDENETTFIVTAAAHNQYLMAEESRKQREEKEAEWNRSLSRIQNASEVQQILKEGNDYIMTVRALNDRIPDPEMSAKMYRLEDIMKKIFEEVRKQPAAAPSLRKFMSYYLPTTVKLLNAYAELDGKPQIGDNIANTKREINQSLDMINDAFEKLFDSMFEDVSWDISSDISVMKTMMAQDGLNSEDVF